MSERVGYRAILKTRDDSYLTEVWLDGEKRYEMGSAFPTVLIWHGRSFLCWTEEERPTAIYKEVSSQFVGEVWRSRQEEPLLGMATTAEMLTELQARAEVGGYAQYRTVGERADGSDIAR